MNTTKDLAFGKLNDMYNLFCRTLKDGIGPNLSTAMVDYIQRYDDLGLLYLKYAVQVTTSPQQFYSSFFKLVQIGWCNRVTLWRYLDTIDEYMLKHELYEMLANGKKLQSGLSFITQNLFVEDRQTNILKSKESELMMEKEIEILQKVFPTIEEDTVGKIHSLAVDFADWYLKAIVEQTIVPTPPAEVAFSVYLQEEEETLIKWFKPNTK